jgi:hypothetical protein
MKIIYGNIIFLIIACFSPLNAEETQNPPSLEGEVILTIKDFQKHSGDLFMGESDENIFKILMIAKSSLIKSICIRELSKRGKTSAKLLELLELKIAKESSAEERNLAAEILLYVENKRAKQLACEYYISQLANPNFVFHNYYHFPSTIILGGAVEANIIIDGNTFKLFMAPAAASIPLLKLKEIALPYLIDLLDENASPNIIASLHAYWLIKQISKKKLPKFGEVWQNPDILKKLKLTESASEKRCESDD